MSEYKCDEPGCYFHIGIGGQVITDDDFEQQDYYNQEVEEHYQMHQEQKRAAAQRKAAAPFRKKLQDRDKVCRVCLGEFTNEPKSTTAPAIMHLDPASVGMVYLARVHQGCLINVAVTKGEWVQARILEENFAMTLGKHASVSLLRNSEGFKSKLVGLHEEAVSRYETEREKFRESASLLASISLVGVPERGLKERHLRDRDDYVRANGYEKALRDLIAELFPTDAVENNSTVDKETQS